MGDLGEDQREWEMEPLTAPAEVPSEPAPEPVETPAPEREPVPA